MKNLLKGLLVLCCFFATTTPVNAADNSMTVTYTGTDNYTVDIPATLALSTNAETSKQEGTYTIKVSGDFTGEVTVTPDATITMKEESGSKADVTANVTQSKTVWTLEDIATDATGKITTAENLGAGVWSGTLNFNITKQ